LTIEKKITFDRIDIMRVNKEKKREYGLTNQQAQEKLADEDFKRIPVSLYKYVLISDTEKMQNQLQEMWRKLDCLGRIYIATEGINAQMSVPEHQWEAFKKQLHAISEFTNVPLKIGIHTGTAFYKLQVKIRKQIVADGLTMNDYNIENVGNHLTAAEFNAAMDETDSLVVDMRNHYESEIGHFDGAITPQVDTFRAELPLVAQELAVNKNNKILLYCTGGIRCEKASAYLKDKGFKDVNQLHGGIIDYKHQVEREGLENKFLGSNYVFDQREPERIGNNVISNCAQCNTLCDRHVNCNNLSCNMLFLQCYDCEQKMSTTCSKKCKKIALLPTDKQKAYYKKFGTSDKLRFSKSLRARKKLKKSQQWFSKIFT